VPFWSRYGYRPLWTTWQAAPASYLAAGTGPGSLSR
jgi:hypothetical protein